MLSILRLIVVGSLIVSIHISAAEFALRAGAARVEITPPRELLEFPALDALHVRALVLACGDTRAVVLAIDSMKIGEKETERIRGSVAASIGVRADHILVNASHAHAAPRHDPSGEAQTKLAPWKSRLPAFAARVTREAHDKLRDVTISISRANVGEWLFNWRTIRPDGTIHPLLRPDDPTVLPAGLRFGPVDPTVTVLRFRDRDERTVATTFHLACHATSLGADTVVSADFPGYAAAEIAQRLGGEALFLQGCAGDIAPAARRGKEECRKMGRAIAERVVASLQGADAIQPEALHISSAWIGLPAAAAYAEQTGQRMVPAEIQVITMEPLAIVGLPGEPMTRISAAIQKASPFPNTLVLGYCNGNGGEYVGAPDEPHGASATSPIPKVAHEAGGFMIATAVRMLQDDFKQRTAFRGSVTSFPRVDTPSAFPTR